MAKSLAETRSDRTAKSKETPVPPLVGNQYYRVYFGATQINFSKVTNVEMTVETDQISEGGLNGYVHVLTKSLGQGGKLTMEKGLVAEDSMNQIMTKLSVGTRLNLPVTITLYHTTNEGLKPVRAWGFEDGMVSAWRLGELDGLGSQLCIETLEITHGGLH
ncbi:MAG: phage tail protein, partial [Eubacteriales bacterium]